MTKPQTTKQSYFQRLKQDSTRYQAHLRANSTYYSQVVKKNPSKLERHLRASREYAHKKRLDAQGVEPMYLLFAGDHFDPSGGAFDLVRGYNQLGQATKAGEALEEVDWWHVYGLAERSIVVRGGETAPSATVSFSHSSTPDISGINPQNGPICLEALNADLDALCTKHGAILRINAGEGFPYVEVIREADFVVDLAERQDLDLRWHDAQGEFSDDE